jgi:hypothetical protein
MKEVKSLDDGYRKHGWLYPTLTTTLPGTIFGFLAALMTDKGIILMNKLARDLGVSSNRVSFLIGICFGITGLYWLYFFIKDLKDSHEGFVKKEEDSQGTHKDKEN